MEPVLFRLHVLTAEAPDALVAVYASAKEGVEVYDDIMRETSTMPSEVRSAFGDMHEALVGILLHAEPYVPEHERVGRV